MFMFYFMEDLGWMNLKYNNTLLGLHEDSKKLTRILREI